MKTIGKVALLAGVGAMAVVGGLIHKRVKEDKELEGLKDIFPGMGETKDSTFAGTGMGFNPMGTMGGAGTTGFRAGAPGFGTGAPLGGMGLGYKGPFGGMGLGHKGPFGAMGFEAFKGMGFKDHAMRGTNLGYDDPFTAPKFYSSFEQEKAHEELEYIFNGDKLELSKFIATCTDDGIEPEDFTGMVDRLRQIAVENSKREESKPGCCKDCQGH